MGESPIWISKNNYRKICLEIEKSRRNNIIADYIEKVSVADGCIVFLDNAVLMSSAVFEKINENSINNKIKYETMEALK